GLWDASADPEFRLATVRPRRTAAPRVEQPGRAGPAGPDLRYVHRVRTWLAADERGRRRLQDSFENRQDALLGSLDERGLSDEGWGVLRHLTFEVHAVLELADGAAPASVPPAALAGTPATTLPTELEGLVDQALASAEQDLAGPVPEAERATVSALGRQVLGALLAARARRGWTRGRTATAGGGAPAKRTTGGGGWRARGGKEQVPLPPGRPGPAAHRAERHVHPLQAGGRRAVHRRRAARGAGQDLRPGRKAAGGEGRTDEAARAARPEGLGSRGGGIPRE